MVLARTSFAQNFKFMIRNVRLDVFESGRSGFRAYEPDLDLENYGGAHDFSSTSARSWFTEFEYEYVYFGTVMQP
ncbi:hypothetical protein RRG08_021440 [Elysia crispata]|uniref:Uncharacterized protein n=1 Tax=Elysia crispata TaxID=231223 RepID=A0AAE1A5N7_9GAST|nr:hypothetical protein RRG08_021440 [Elysia crispata]